jgi:hypothetical protein
MAFQCDGKYDGKNLAQIPSDFFTVSAEWLLTVKKCQNVHTEQQFRDIVAAKLS